MYTEVKRLEEEVFRYLPREIREAVLKCGKVMDTLEEIRIRGDKPVMLSYSAGDSFLRPDGRLSMDRSEVLHARQEDLLKILDAISGSSVYAFQEEIRSGFITLKGGHRVGLAGRIVMDQNGIKSIKDFSGMNIRISREIKGCAIKIMKYIVNGNHDVFNTLVISPPQCGKTTILRDLARILSEGYEEKDFKGIKVGIVDERSEIAACHKGLPQNDVGLRTDVLDGCPKAYGMTMLLRSMSPQVIITDEIGGAGDKEAIMTVINAGVRIIASAHGYNISGLKSRKDVISIVESKIFDRYIVLSGYEGPGTLEEVIEGHNMNQLYRRS